MNRVLVTGARGYIGGAIARCLAASGLEVHGGIRAPAPLPAGIAPLVTGDLADAALQLERFDAVVHAAGLGHRRGLPPAAWQRANVQAAVNLARQAARAGVPRLLLISTAHVHGRVAPGPVRDDGALHPMDDYAASKLQAETEVAACFGAGLCIMRPVAVIGPHCPGNLQLLMRLLRKRVPLPFGAIANRRSFIAAGDLARLVAAALAHPHPPARILAASPEAISTPELIRTLAAGLRVRPILPAVPPGILAGLARLLGREAMWQSLAGDFVAAPVAASALGFAPRRSLRENLLETARYYDTTHPDP